MAFNLHQKRTTLDDLFSKTRNVYVKRENYAVIKNLKKNPSNKSLNRIRCLMALFYSMSIIFQLVLYFQLFLCFVLASFNIHHIFMTGLTDGSGEIERERERIKCSKTLWRVKDDFLESSSPTKSRERKEKYFHIIWKASIIDLCSMFYCLVNHNWCFWRRENKNNGIVMTSVSVWCLKSNQHKPKKLFLRFSLS